MSESLVLDTHIWYWHVEGKQRRMSKAVRHRIERAVRAGRAVVSVISAWELGVLVARRRLALATEIAAWIEATREPPGVLFADITPEIALAASRIAPGDPGDVLIMATAKSLGATLVTCDERIIEYGEAGGLRVLDARP